MQVLVVEARQVCGVDCLLARLLVRPEYLSLCQAG